LRIEWLHWRVQIRADGAIVSVNHLPMDAMSSPLPS